MKISGRILSLLLVAILAAACGGRSGAEPTMDINAVLTSGVGTMVAAHFETQTALYTPPVDTSTSEPLPSETPIPFPTLAPSPTNQIIYYTATLGTGTPSLTPSVTGTILTATVDPASVAYGCNNLSLVFDVTVPNGTNFKAGEEFTKTWKVENNGTCDWKYPYRLVFVSGAQLNGVDSKLLKKTITPGNWTELSVDLVAPGTKGTYTGYWRMSDSDGHLFGVNLAVSIKVGTPPTDTPTVTSAPTSFPTATSTPTLQPTATDTETVTPDTPTP
jgi:Ig-like domain from next to BRCA1 gene